MPAMIPYNATREALYSPERQGALPPQWFAGKPDALCAELARLAYFRFENDPEPLRAALAALGLGQFTPFVNRHVNTQAFAALDAQGTAWVAFRGTQPDSLKDLLTDVRALPLGWIGGSQVHSGFARAYDPPAGKIDAGNVNPRAEIARWLVQARPARLICTGHSLGAALATLLASDRPEAELATFGSPRVGNGAFARLFAGRKARRYVDCTDGVTSLPPPLFYAHAGDMVYIDRKGVPHPEGLSTIAQLADRGAAELDYGAKYAVQPLRYVALRSFADHAPINYVSALLGMRGA